MQPHQLGSGTAESLQLILSTGCHPGSRPWYIMTQPVDKLNILQADKWLIYIVCLCNIATLREFANNGVFVGGVQHSSGWIFSISEETFGSRMGTNHAMLPDVAQETHQETLRHVFQQWGTVCTAT